METFKFYILELEKFYKAYLSYHRPEDIDYTNYHIEILKITPDEKGFGAFVTIKCQPRVLFWIGTIYGRI